MLRVGYGDSRELLCLRMSDAKTLKKIFDKYAQVKLSKVLNFQLWCWPCYAPLGEEFETSKVFGCDLSGSIFTGHNKILINIVFLL